MDCSHFAYYSTSLKAVSEFYKNYNWNKKKQVRLTTLKSSNQDICDLILTSNTPALDPPLKMLFPILSSAIYTTILK